MLCPNQANGNGYGGDTFTPTVGSLDATCGADSAITMFIPNESSGYARLAWVSGTAASYPAGLALGGLLGLNADVVYTGPSDDQPFYMLAFTDSSNGLGQRASIDQILMLEFQSSTLSGNGLGLDPKTTEFNLYDNTAGEYLNQSNGGQQYTNTLAGWLSVDPFLASESLQEIRVGIGMAGGGSSPESLTVNSLDVTTPEPTSLVLLLVLIAAMFGRLGWRLDRGGKGK